MAPFLAQGAAGFFAWPGLLLLYLLCVTGISTDQLENQRNGGEAIYIDGSAGMMLP
mgnify:CR=1 FL=1